MYAVKDASGLPPEVHAEFSYLSSRLKAWVAVDHNEDGTHHVPVLPEAIPVGSIVMWASNTAPEHWLLCNGDAVSRTVYQGLFELIGVTYGAGDGSTTFNVPDLRQRVPLGKAASGTGNTLGSTGGSIDHTHSFSGGTTGANGGFSTSTDAGGTGTTSTDNTGIVLTASVTSPPDGPTVSAFGHTHTGPSHTHSITVSDHTHSLGGGSTDADNMPYLVLNYIILTGV